MDKDLIDKLKNKDEQAFKMLVYEYQDMVFRTCMSILHERDDADDVTQEVFIEAYHSVYNFRANAKISTWLYRIAINKSLNYIRDNKRRKLLQSIGLIKGLDIADDDQSFDQPHEQFSEKQRKKLIDAAIDALPANQKSAFLLSKIEKLSYKEIADILNISIPSIESLIFRAKKNLQKKLIHHYKKSC